MKHDALRSGLLLFIIRRSKRLRERPPSRAEALLMTGGSCLWSPISATCWLCKSGLVGSYIGNTKGNSTRPKHERHQRSWLCRHRSFVQEDCREIHQAKRPRSCCQTCGTNLSHKIITSLIILSLDINHVQHQPTAECDTSLTFPNPWSRFLDDRGRHEVGLSVVSAEVPAELAHRDRPIFSGLVGDKPFVKFSNCACLLSVSSLKAANLSQSG